MTGGEPIVRSAFTFLGLSGSEAERGFARFAVLPTPFDGTTVRLAGARFGPEAIIAASRAVELYDEELSFEAWRLGIHTLAPLAPVGAPEAALGAVKQTVEALITEGKLPVLLGGERSLTAAAVEGALEAATQRLTLLTIDAHANMRESESGFAVSHAATMRRLSERVRLVQVGVRACASEETAALGRGTVTTHFMHAIRRRQIGEVIAEIGESIKRDLYISIDLDGLDPSIMPAVARPEPGGLLWWELLALLRMVISNATVVGFDVVGLTPIPGHTAPDFLAARLAYKIIGYIAKYQAFWRPGQDATLPPTRIIPSGDQPTQVL